MRWATQILCFLLVFAATDVRAAESPHSVSLDDAKLAPFIKQHCVRCHGQDRPKGDVRLDNAAFAIATVEQAQWWQDVLDTLNGGVMPPKKEPQPPNQELASAISELTDKLTIARRQWDSKGGRTVLRRLSPREYAATIRHLFGFEPDLTEIPDDPNVKPFDTVGSDQVFSSNHIERYSELGQKIVAAGFRLASVHEHRQSVKSEPEVRKNQFNWVQSVSRQPARFDLSRFSSGFAF